MTKKKRPEDLLPTGRRRQTKLIPDDSSIDGILVNDKASTEFLEDFKRRRAKNTWIGIRTSLAMFLKWYGKTGTQILEENIEPEIISRKLEEFARCLLEEKAKELTVATRCQGIHRFMKHFRRPFEMPEFINGLGRTESILYYPLTHEDLVTMFKHGNLLQRVIISLECDLGIRDGDFALIKKDMIPNLYQDSPISFKIISEKEKVLADTFLSAETIELLKLYIPTLDNENPYLFQSPRYKNKNMLPDTINDMTTKLFFDSGLKIPSPYKFVRFHSIRARVYSTLAEQGIIESTADRLIGKATDASKKPYLKGVDTKSAFLKMRNALSLTGYITTDKDAIITDLKGILIKKELEIKDLKIEKEVITERLAKIEAYCKEHNILMRPTEHMVKMWDRLEKIQKEINARNRLIRKLQDRITVLEKRKVKRLLQLRKET